MDLTSLLHRLDLMHKHYINRRLAQDTKLQSWNPSQEKFFDEDCLKLFNLFFFVKMVTETNSGAKKELEKLSNNYGELLAFFERNSSSVEIVMDGSIKRVYFPKHPICAFLLSQHKA